MNNVIAFPKRDEENFEHLLDDVKANAEQIVAIWKNKNGQIQLGHTELKVHDLIIMLYTIQRHVQLLLDMPLMGDDDDDE